MNGKERPADGVKEALREEAVSTATIEQHHRKGAMKEGRGGVVGGLTGSWSSGGLEVMLFLCPSQYRQEGAKRVCPSLWYPQVGFVVCLHGSYSTKLSLSSTRETNKQAFLSLSVCVYISSLCSLPPSLHPLFYVQTDMWLCVSSYLCFYQYYKQLWFVQKLNILIVHQSSINSKTVTVNLRIYIQMKPRGSILFYDFVPIQALTLFLCTHLFK